MKQRASVTASAPATIRRVWPTAAGGSLQGVAFQFVKVMALVMSVHAIQTLDLVLSSAAAVVAVSPAARAQGRGSRAWRRAAPELAGREQVQGGQQHADPGCGRQRVQREGVPSPTGPWMIATVACSRAGWPMARAVSGTVSSAAGVSSATPIHSTGSRAAKPATGPAAATSNAARRVGWSLPEAHEGAEGPGEGRSGDEERRRDGEPVVARRAPVPDLVRAEDAEREPHAVEGGDALQRHLSSPVTRVR